MNAEHRAGTKGGWVAPGLRRLVQGRLFLKPLCLWPQHQIPQCEILRIPDFAVKGFRVLPPFFVIRRPSARPQLTASMRGRRFQRPRRPSLHDFGSLPCWDLGGFRSSGDGDSTTFLGVAIWHSGLWGLAGLASDLMN